MWSLPIMLICETFFADQFSYVYMTLTNLEWLNHYLTTFTNANGH